MLRFTHWIFCIFLFISHSLCALTTLIVTSSTDDDPGGMGNVGELRYYLNLMNENLSTGSDDYAITFQFPMTITLNGNLPIINNSTYPVSITIGNSGSIPTVTIDGNGAYSGFFIPNGNVTIQNMNFQNLIAKGGGWWRRHFWWRRWNGGWRCYLCTYQFFKWYKPYGYLDECIDKELYCSGRNGGQIFKSSFPYR